jgi:putative hydrolase of the HAD superfamily
VKLPAAALERGYERSAEFLGRLWSENRDVPVTEHVRAILEGAEAGLADRLPAAAREGLVEAYARPALVVPPAVDPGARPALQALRNRGLALAVVSNTMRTPGRVLRQILAHHGVLDCFAQTTFSDEVGVRKPAAEIFALTLAALGSAAGEGVHVGDDPVLDVLGARAAGMRAIQVTAHPSGSRRGERPDVAIRRLAELPAALAALEGG